MRAGVIIFLIGLLAPAACSSPTEPDSRTGYMALRVACIDGASPLICVSQTYCAGLYRCPDPAGDKADVTGRSEWMVEHPHIVRQQSQPNWFVAEAPGDTVVRVRDPVIQQEAAVRLSVFPGTPPLQTSEVWGRVERSTEN